MYNDTLKVANKIITYDDLNEIFSLMQEKLVQCKKIYANEEIQNKMLEYSYQKWTMQYFSGSLTFDVNFYDDTTIKFDNYNSFVGIFNSRLNEIKRIYVYFYISYDVNDGVKKGHYRHSINLDIKESKIDINVELNSEDKKIDDVFELIKNKILNAPEKYDNVIRRRSSIITISGFGIGMIPALVITTILLFVPSIRHIFAVSYVLYPLLTVVLGFFIGGTISSSKLDSFYETLKPKQKYAGYDSNQGKSIYKDDIDDYVDTSEILIGKNVDNLKNRNMIMTYYNKYKKFIPYDLGVMLVISIIVLFLGNI